MGSVVTMEETLQLPTTDAKEGDDDGDKKNKNSALEVVEQTHSRSTTPTPRVAVIDDASPLHQQQQQPPILPQPHDQHPHPQHNNNWIPNPSLGPYPIPNANGNQPNSGRSSPWMMGGGGGPNSSHHQHPSQLGMGMNGGSMGGPYGMPGGQGMLKPNMFPTSPSASPSLLSSSPSSHPHLPHPHSHPHSQPHPPLPPNDTRTQIFIANLPFRVRWQDLKDLMRKVGTVLRADVALSQPDGRSRGFGVVLFARNEDAISAIERYHGYVWQTRTLDVRLDTQDPTGVYALAEANRQAAVQQQVQSYHHLSSISPQMGGQMPMAMPIPGYGPGPGPGMGMPMPIPIQMTGGGGGVGMRSASPLPGGGGGGVGGPAPLVGSVGSSSAGTLGGSPRAEMGTTTTTTKAKSVMGSPPEGGSPNTGATPEDEKKEPNEKGDSAVVLPTSSDSAIADSTDTSPNLAPNPIVPRPHSGMGNYPYSQQQQHAPPPSYGNGPMGMMGPGHGGGGGGMHSMGGMSGMSGMGMGGMGMGMGGGMSMGMGGGMMGMGMGMGGGGGMMGMSSGPFGGGGGGGMANFYQNQRVPSQGGPGGPGTNPVPQAYANRHLFVGNLPFNCQWQELKDLMRTAGAVLRADIAQGTDGRSRGFGSVLFTSPQDAERACQMFNGYDYNGRALKVHFDKFAHTASNGGGAGGPSPMFAAQTLPNGGSGPQHHPYQDRPYNIGQGFPLQGSHHAYDRRPSAFSSDRYNSPDDHQSSSSTSKLPSATPNSSGPIDRTASKDDAPENGASPHGSPGDRNRPHASPPGKISMPPPFPFAGPLSPLQGRNLPPMTPSMPAFTLGAFPQTPPLYPQFFSPGLGAFSPTMGSPLFGPGHHFNMNVAPGAPVHRDGYSSFQSSFGNNVAPTPSAYQDVHYSSPPGSETIPQEPSYFPPVVATSDNSPSATSSSHSESSTPATVHNSPDPDSTTPTIEAEPDLANLTLADSSKLTPGWGGLGVSGLGAGGEEKVRRKSFVTPSAISTGSGSGDTSADIRRRFEGEGLRAASGSQERRASFDDGLGRPVRPKAFGTSIWQAS